MTRLKELRRARALAQKALARSDSAAARAALEDAETELANAVADVTDDERLSSVASQLGPLIEQLSQNATTEPTRSWTQCVRVAAALLEEAQRAKKDGSPIDPQRLGSQVEQLIEALTRIRPS